MRNFKFIMQLRFWNDTPNQQKVLDFVDTFTTPERGIGSSVRYEARMTETTLDLHRIPDIINPIGDGPKKVVCKQYEKRF